jgi:hypothetical protein
LVGQVWNTLKGGQVVAVVGWRSSDHDDFTRSLPATQVLFVGNSVPPEPIGFTLMTKVVSPQLRGKASHRRKAAPVLLEAVQVRECLTQCRDLLKPVPKTQPAPLPSGAAAETPKPPDLVLPEAVLDFMTKPNKELTKMERFVAAFLAEAAKRTDGMVGKRTLGKLIREYEVEETPPVLVQAGWIVPKVSDGRTKIGWYQAGEKMQQASEQIEQMPEDPVARARLLVSQKEATLAEKAALQEKLTKVEDKLKLIEQAEGLFAQFDKFSQTLKG